MFDFNQLRCFVAVAEELHFGRAAARLNMTQPPLSRQIQLLEHSIGTPLFSRANRTVKLTAAGRHLLPEARAILRMVRNASLSAQRIGTGDAGRVVIGFTAAAGYQFLPDTLTHLRRQLPDIRLELREMVSQVQIEALDSGQIDVGLLRPPVSHPGLRSRRIAREALVVALPSGHPLSHQNAVRLSDLRQHPIVMYSPDESRYFHDLVNSLLTRGGMTPRYHQQVSQVHSVLALVRAGLGLALVPEAASNLRYASIVYRKLTGISPAPTHPVELHLAWKGDNDNPALAQVLTHLPDNKRRR